MKSETATQLVSTISHALGIAVDNRNKITAFERLLEQKDSALFDEYKNILEKVRDNPPTVIFSQGLEGLHTKLIQD
jgi:hypothetical protein